MGAVAQLCNSAILLDRGAIAARGDVQHVIGAYFDRNSGLELSDSDFNGPLASSVHFKEFLINDQPTSPELSPSSEIVFTLRGHCDRVVPRFRASVAIYREGILLATLHEHSEPQRLHEGSFEMTIKLPPFQLRPGTYNLALGGGDAGAFTRGTDWLFSHPLGSFSIREEWGPANDFGSTGWVNLQHSGTSVNGLRRDAPLHAEDQK